MKTDNTTTRTRRKASWLIFLAVQAVIVPAVIAVPLVRSWSAKPMPRLPEFQTEPITVRPQYDDPRVVTDEQLAMVFHKLRPQFRHQQPKINHVDHALRFWGVEAEFEDPNCLSGQEMRQLLINHPTFVDAWGDRARPLLIENENGIAVRTQMGNATSSHVDHTLGTLAEIGTPLDFPLVTVNGETNVEAMLRQALLDFRLNQIEYEWTTVALCLYSPSSEPWYSKEGERITFDRLAERIMRQGYAQGVCYGNHRIFTLTLMLRVDDQYHILSDAARNQIVEHLTDATRRLLATQSAEGWWNSRWPTGKAAAGPAKTDSEVLSERVLATGHALEWWAMAPAELQPPREVLARAGQWLVREVEQMDEETIKEGYPFLTHVGRALALWRGGFPAELQKKLKSKAQGA